MKEKWSKSIKYLLWALCMVVVMGACLKFGTVKAEAASAKSKAIKAYKKLLSQKEIAWDSNWKVASKDCKFAIVYIDNNTVPELVVYCPTVTHAARFGRLYTYRNGKVVRVGGVDIDDGKFRYYKKKGIYISRYVMGGVFDGYCKLSKGKSTSKLQKNKYVYVDHNETSYANSKGKTITKSKFTKELKKLVGSKKVSTAKFYKNTANNRKKYCK